MAKRNISTEIKLDGEQAFKKAMSEINSGLKVLGSELKLSTAQFKSQANSLAALTDKHDILSRSILTQKDKVEEAKKALQESAQAYGESDKRTQAWQVTLNNAERELVGMYEELGKTEKYLEEASKATDKCAKSLDEYGNEIEQAEKKTSKFGEIFKGAFWANLASQAFTAVIGKIKEFASASIEAADKYGTMADIYSMTSDRIQELEFAGIRLDVSLETMTGSMTKLVRNMNSARAGSKLQAEAFAKLGIEITRADGSLREANDVFGEAIDALGKVRGETERDAIAMQLFGKSAMDLNPLIKAGSAELQALSEKAHEMGAVMSEDAVNALDNLDETLQEIKMSAQAFVGEALAAIIGDGKTAAEVMDDLQESLSNTSNTQKLIDKFNRLNAELSSGTLSAEEAKKKNAELEQVKQDLIAASDGVATALDIENGTFEQQIAVLDELNEAERNYYKHKLTNQVLENSGAALAKKSADADVRYAKAKESLVVASKAVAEAEEAIASGRKKAWHGGDYEEILMSSAALVEFYKDEMRDASSAQTDVSESALKAQAAIKTLVDGGYMEAAEACETFNLTGEELAATLAKTGDTSDSTIPQVQALKDSIGELNAEYEAVYNAAYESAMGQFSLWDMVDEVVATSTADIIANLESQAQYFNNYADNFNALTDRVVTDASGMEVDTSKLIASLQDGSAQSAAILAGLAQASDQEIANVVKAMSGVEVGAGNFAAAVGEAETNYDERMAKMVNTTVESVKEMDLSDKAKESALNTINGYINGVRAQSGQLNLTMTKAAQDALNAWKKVFREASPSRAMMESGKNAIDGAIIGVENEQGKLVSLYTTMGEKLLTGLSKGMKDSSGKVMQTADDITKELAKRVGDIVNVFSTSSDISELQYKLWEMTAKNATEKEKTEKQVESLNKQTEIQKSKIESVSGAYKKMVEMTGENSDESLRLQKQLLQEQIELEKLKDTIKDLTEAKKSAYNADNLSKMAEQEFKLWSLQNQSASDGEKLAKQAELLALKYEMQGENVSEAEAALADMVKQYGANNAESVKLQEQLFKEKIAYMELKAQIDEVNRARGYVGGTGIAPSGFLQAAQIWEGLSSVKINTDISGLNGLSKPDVGGMIAGAVNAMGTMGNGSNGRTVIELRNIVNGKEFSRAIIEDFRAVDASSPKVVSDRM